MLNLCTTYPHFSFICSYTIGCLCLPDINSLILVYFYWCIAVVWLCIAFSILFSYLRYYGGTLSEKVLGKALKALGVPRNEYVVSTKCGRYVEGFDFSADRVTRSIDESLERLQLDYVDILQCHDIEFVDLDQVLKYFLSSFSHLCSFSCIYKLSYW